MSIHEGKKLVRPDFTLEKYALYDRPVTTDFREYVLARFPALQDGEHALFYRRTLQFVFFSRFLDEATGHQVLHGDVVAYLAGVTPRANSFRACEWIRRFNADVLDLRASGWHFTQARTIDPDIPADVDARLLTEFAARRRRKNGDGLVYFVSGEPVTRKHLQFRQREYRAYLDSLIDNPPDDHPALPLLAILNGSSQRCLRGIVSNNWDALNDYADTLPTDTPLQLEQRKYVERCLADITNNGVVLRYSDSESTARVFARGVNINSLPRELRKIALRGTVALDLAAAQLAIVSKYYKCSMLHAFLLDSRISGRSFWAEMLEYLGLGSERKQILKDCIYGITFGMGRENYTSLLAEGTVKQRDKIIKVSDDPGIGRKLTAKFRRHPLVRELLDGRQKTIRRIIERGGAKDAFGRWMSSESAYPPSLLARIAQSYEVRLMMAIVPIVQAEPGIEIVSFIHDGVYLHFKQAREKARQLRRIRDAVRVEADRLDIPTEFDR